MQTFVFPTVFYIWKVLLICRGGYYPPASKDTNIVIEINYINITKLLLFCRGEPFSPVRVHCTRLQALRAKLNTQFMLYQNILYKHKHSSSGRIISPKTGCGIIQNLGSSVLHNKLNLYIVGFFLFWY